MIDYLQGACRCRLEARPCEPVLHHNHCHFERHREESVGPLTRTTLSHTTDCHLHDPSTPCPGPRQFNVYRGDHPSRSHQCRSQDADGHAALLRSLQELIDNRANESDIRRLINDAVQQSIRSNERGVLVDAITQALQQSDNRNHNYHHSANSHHNDIEIDVLLDFEGMADRSRSTVPRLRRARSRSRRDLLNILTSGSTSRNITPVSMSEWTPNGYGISIGTPVAFGNTHARDGPGWIGGFCL